MAVNKQYNLNKSHIRCIKYAYRYVKNNALLIGNQFGFTKRDQSDDYESVNVGKCCATLLIHFVAIKCNNWLKNTKYCNTFIFELNQIINVCLVSSIKETYLDHGVISIAK